MKKIQKFFFYLDYFWYHLVLVKIPYAPGENMRYRYLKKKMGARLGQNVKIGEDTVIGSYDLVSIGDNVRMTNQIIIGYEVGGKIIIKDGALIGQGSLIVNNMHEYRMKDVPPGDQGYILPFKDTVIGEHTWLGARVIVMPGVNIGRECVIGAGAVVTKDIPDRSVAVGVPARVIKDVVMFPDKKEKVRASVKKITKAPTK